MAFNIKDFRAEVDKKHGLMKTNKFLITFVAPSIATYLPYDNQPRRDFDRNVEFWCESINLPGYAFEMHGTRRWSYGPEEARPFAAKTQPLLCNFLADSDGHVYNFFNTWMTNIIPHHTPNGMALNPDRVNTILGKGILPYEIRYKQEYVTDIHIYIFDEAGKNTIHVVCKEAFPSQIMDMPLSWGNNDVAQFQIGIEYLDWYQEATLIKGPTLPTSSEIFNL